MHPLAYKHLKKVLADKKLVGPKTDCEYYPCHFLGQDCTWCFCPLYPCEDPQTGGEWLRRKDRTGTVTSVWNCTYCYWIHRSEVAEELLDILHELGIERVEDLDRDIERERRRIFQYLKDRCPPERKRKKQEIEDRE